MGPHQDSACVGFMYNIGNGNGILFIFIHGKSFSKDYKMIKDRLIIQLT